MAYMPHKRPTAEGLMYRGLNRFTLYGISLKEAPTTTLEKSLKKIYLCIYILFYIIYMINILFYIYMFNKY